MNHVTYILSLILIASALSACSHFKPAAKPADADYPLPLQFTEHGRISDALRIAAVRVNQLEHSGGQECMPGRIYNMRKLLLVANGEHESGLNEDAALNLRTLDQRIEEAEKGLTFLHASSTCLGEQHDDALAEILPLLEQLSRTNFASGSAQMPAEMPKLLDELAKWLILNPNFKVTLVGHTDARGSIENNEHLALNRAATVSRYLIAHNVDAHQLRCNGEGPWNPISHNANEQSRKYNRRVEVIASRMDEETFKIDKLKYWPRITDIWGGK
ncbi:OmpA family protein [Marinomonas balearica]|uniref:OmpA family protein n=1 Tax=Marinomonas balearica TaxID=491947 RepID=A0A4R6MHD3_9GAMM|nr:OmpA family protein [Marinomonas balearica]TDP01075.1 OmpA family protein [Marinomonas balearica]